MVISRPRQDGGHVSLKSQLQTQATEDTGRREQKTDGETSLQDVNIVAPLVEPEHGGTLQQEGAPELKGALEF